MAMSARKQIDILSGEIQRLTLVNDDLVLELRKVEWSGERGDISGYCPKCGRHRHEGHLSYCTLAAAIDKATRGEGE